MNSHNHSRAGFSLVEVAIVLAVIGIVLAGIWVYASRAFESEHRQRALEEMITVVNNIRSLYAGQASISSADSSVAVLVPILIQQNAIPSTMARSGAPCTNTPALCADNPWAVSATLVGSFRVCGWDYTGPASAGQGCSKVASPKQYFAIELVGLNQDSCTAMIPRISSSEGPPGLVDVVANGSSMLNPATAGLTAYSLPVMVQDASTVCSTITPAHVYFVYRLRASSF